MVARQRLTSELTDLQKELALLADAAPTRVQSDYVPQLLRDMRAIFDNLGASSLNIRLVTRLTARHTCPVKEERSPTLLASRVTLISECCLIGPRLSGKADP
jgi:hypothetical protein